MTEGERRARLVTQAIVAVIGNVALPGKYADIAIALALEIASGRKAVGRWVLIRYGIIAERAASSRQHVRRLVKAMETDGLVNARRSGSYPTPNGYRMDLFLRSAVGDELIDLLRAFALWVPDWGKVDPREDHAAKACPDCGHTEFLVQKWCKGCGALVAEYTEGGPSVDPVVATDG